MTKDRCIPESRKKTIRHNLVHSDAVAVPYQYNFFDYTGPLAYIVDTLSCDGDESRLSECQLTIKQSSTCEQGAAGVHCHGNCSILLHVTKI